MNTKNNLKLTELELQNLYQEMVDQGEIDLGVITSANGDEKSVDEWHPSIGKPPQLDESKST